METCDNCGRGPIEPGTWQCVPCFEADEAIEAVEVLTRQRAETRRQAERLAKRVELLRKWKGEQR